MVIKTSSSSRSCGGGGGGGCGDSGEYHRNSRALHNTTSTSAASSFQNFPPSPSSSTSQSVVDYNSRGWPRLPPVSHEFGSKQHYRSNKHGNSNNSSGRRTRGGPSRSKDSDSIDTNKTHLKKQDKDYDRGDSSLVDNCWQGNNNRFRNAEGFNMNAKDSRGQTQAEFIENSYGGNTISRNYEHYSALNDERAFQNVGNDDRCRTNSASPLSSIEFKEHGPERPKISSQGFMGHADRRMDVSEVHRDAPHQVNKTDKSSVGCSEPSTGAGLHTDGCMEPKVGVAAGTEIDFHVLAACCDMMKQQEYQMQQQHYSNHVIQQQAQRDRLEHLFNLEQKHKIETQQRLQHQHFLYGIEAMERQRIQAHDQQQHQFNEDYRIFLQHLESERRACLAVQQRDNFPPPCVPQPNQNRPVFQQNGYNLDPLTSLIPNFISANSLPSNGTSRSSPAPEHGVVKPSSGRGQVSCVGDAKFVGNSVAMPVPASNTDNETVPIVDKRNKNYDRHKCDENLIRDFINLDLAVEEPSKDHGMHKAGKKRRKHVESSCSQLEIKDMLVQNCLSNENSPRSCNASLRETEVPIDVLFGKLEVSASKAASLGGNSVSNLNGAVDDEIHSHGSENISKKLENYVDQSPNEDLESVVTGSKTKNSPQRIDAFSKTVLEKPAESNNKISNIKGSLGSSSHGRSSVLNHLLNSRFTLVTAPCMTRDCSEEPAGENSSTNVKTPGEQPCSNSKSLIVPSCVALLKDTSSKESSRPTKESAKLTRRKLSGRSKSPAKVPVTTQSTSESSSIESLSQDRKKAIYQVDEQARQFLNEGINNFKENNPAVPKVSSTQSNVPVNLVKVVTSLAASSSSLASNSASESQFHQANLKSSDSDALIRQVNSPNPFFHQGMMPEGSVYPATSHSSSLPIVSAHHNIPTMLPNNYTNPLLPQQALPGMGIRFPVYPLPVAAHPNFQPSQPAFISAPFPPMNIPPFHPYHVEPQCSIPPPPYPPNAAYSFALSSQYSASVPFSTASLLQQPIMCKDSGNGRISSDLSNQLSNLFIDGIRNSNECLSETSSVKHSTCSKNKKSLNHASCKHKSSENRYDRDRHAKGSDSTMSSINLRSARKSHKHHPSYSKSYTDGSNANTDSSSTCSVKTHPRAGKTLKEAMNDHSLTSRPSPLPVDALSVPRLPTETPRSRCENDERASPFPSIPISCSLSSTPVSCSNYTLQVSTELSQNVASQQVNRMTAVQSVCTNSNQVTVSTAIFRNMNSVCAITPPTSPLKNSSLGVASIKDGLKPLEDYSNTGSSKRKHHKHSHSSHNRHRDDRHLSSNSRGSSPCDTRVAEESVKRTEKTSSENGGTANSALHTKSHSFEPTTLGGSAPTTPYELSNPVTISTTSSPRTSQSSIPCTAPQPTGILIPSLPRFRDSVAPSKKLKAVDEHFTSVPIVDRRKSSAAVSSSKRKKDGYESSSSPASTPATESNSSNLVNVGVASRRTHKPPQLVLARQRLSSIELPDVITPDTPNVPTALPKFRLVLK